MKHFLRNIIYCYKQNNVIHQRNVYGLQIPAWKVLLTLNEEDDNYLCIWAVMAQYKQKFDNDGELEDL